MWSEHLPQCSTDRVEMVCSAPWETTSSKKPHELGGSLPRTSQPFRARALRNPLTHFRTPLHAELPDVRAFQEDRDLYELAVSDAKHVLQVALRLVAINAVA